MTNQMAKAYLLIAITLLMGMVLTILPLPGAFVWLRPYWVLLITIFWLLTAPQWMGIGLAWMIGLVMDLLTGTLLGQQAMMFSICAYFVLKLQNWMVHMPLIQQTSAILMLVIVYSITSMAINVFVLHSEVYSHFWLPAVTSVVIWPWLSALLYYGSKNTC